MRPRPNYKILRQLQRVAAPEATMPSIFPPSATSNYFGDGSDGNVTIATNTDLTSVEDGDMVVKNYSGLTINSGVTLTVANRCKGLVVFVDGDCVINGTLSMTGRGAKGDPTSTVSATGLRLPMLKSGQSDSLAAADFAGCGTSVIAAFGNQPGISGNGKIYVIPRVGGAGGAGLTTTPITSDGNNGGTIANGSGGGGGGGMWANSNAASGSGGLGSCWSGGAGGGSCSSSDTTSTAGEDYGGAGGDSFSPSASGTGNPGGRTLSNDGTGGVLILIVSGSLTIGASGSIEADGVVGANAGEVGGPGSGGGIVWALYAGTLANSGSVTADGGGPGIGTYDGGAGGAGTVVLEQIDGAA